MDFSKIFIKRAKPTNIGGQAVIEGIIMRGLTKSALAVRLSSGDVYLKTTENKSLKSYQKLPFLRGIFALFSSLYIGTKAITDAVSILEKYDSEKEEAEPDFLTKFLNKHFSPETSMKIAMIFSIIISLVFTIFVFILLPTIVLDLLKSLDLHFIVLNLIEGFLRIGMFILYVYVISKLKDIKRVFQFHGAEHKTIHCFENGLELVPENCHPFYRLHPRCGTSFLMFVMVLSLILFSFMGWPNVVLRIVSRLLLLPVIASLSYEILRIAGKSDGKLVRILSVPGLYLQKLTTKEPEDEHLEVAIIAMKAILEDRPVGEGIYDEAKATL